KLMEHLSGVFTKNATVNGIDLFYEDAILLLVSVNHQIKDIERYRKEMVVQIKKQINKYINVSPTLGVRCLTHSIEIINRYNIYKQLLQWTIFIRCLKEILFILRK